MLDESRKKKIVHRTLLILIVRPVKKKKKKKKKTNQTTPRGGGEKKGGETTDCIFSFDVWSDRKGDRGGGSTTYRRSWGSHFTLRFVTHIPGSRGEGGRGEKDSLDSFILVHSLYREGRGEKGRGIKQLLFVHPNAHCCFPSWGEKRKGATL